MDEQTRIKVIPEVNMAIGKKNILSVPYGESMVFE
jgi:hypothetical protein